MTLLDAGVWGMTGAAAVEVMELYGAVKANKVFPWMAEDELPLGVYLFSIVLGWPLVCLQQWYARLLARSVWPERWQLVSPRRSCWRNSAAMHLKSILHLSDHHKRRLR